MAFNVIVSSKVFNTCYLNTGGHNAQINLSRNCEYYILANTVIHMRHHNTLSYLTATEVVKPPALYTLVTQDLSL